MPAAFDPMLAMFVAFGMLFLGMLIRVIRGMSQRRICIENKARGSQAKS